MDQALANIFGFDRRDSIMDQRCVPRPIGCGGPVSDEDFANEIERKEYRISGLCAACQRAIFG